MDGEQDLDTYRVTLSGNGISVDRNVDQTVARQILNFLLGGDSLLSSGSARPQSPVQGDLPSSDSSDREAPRFSLREFIEDAGAKRNPDKILAMGEYMVEHDGAQDFSRDDIKARFRTAGEAVPANYARDFHWAVQNGWVAEDPNSAGRFYVTRRGKEAIAQKFSSEVRKASAQKPTSRRRLRRSHTNLVDPGATE